MRRMRRWVSRRRRSRRRRSRMERRRCGVTESM